LKLKAGAILLMLAGLAAVPAAAHHSFAAEFDGSKAVRLVGKLTKVDWSNPHTYFYIDVKDEKGQIVNWGCEGAGPGALSRRGMKKGDLAKFIEEAVRWRVFDQTVAETKARNAEIPAREINAAIDEALAVVRAEKFGSRRT